MSALGLLLGLRLRRDRVQLALWIIGTAALALFATVSLADTFGSADERRTLLALAIATPAVLVFRGTPNGAGLDEVTFFAIFAFLALLAGLMSTFLAVRHTRGDEEQGRAEMVSATSAGRMTPVLATLVHGIGANAVLGAAVAVAFVAGGLDATGSGVAGAAVAACGVAFLAFGLFAAQVLRTSRGANGLSVAFVVGAYVLRGLGDAAGTASPDLLSVTPAWPSRLSPIGWAQRTGAWNQNDLMPLLLDLVFAAVLVAVVLALQSVRDTGASLLAPRAGRATAPAALSGSFGLAWRLTRAGVLAWAVGAFVAGVLATTLTTLVGRIGEQAPEVAATLGRLSRAGSTLEQALVATIFSLVGMLAAACAIQVMIRARQEETSGTAELLLGSSPVGRLRWAATYVGAGAVGIAIVLLAAFLGAVLGAAGGGETSAAIGDAAQAAVGQVPVALVFLGVALVVFVLLPALTVPLTWSLLGLATILGIFGGLIGLPEWIVDLSPFANSPVPAGDSVDWTGGVWMLVIAAAAITGGTVIAGRRELRTGG
ncbi:ABC transporter permease [Arthrobacter ruber]|uniref:ABC transporter permease n=1 Tax=Arthrobacter ruber TaxID=1258893 RepID=UPI000CF3C996|nr:polyketide antibiotic transporter [Arthrobacter ruber]